MRVCVYACLYTRVYVRVHATYVRTYECVAVAQWFEFFNLLFAVRAFSHNLYGRDVVGKVARRIPRANTLHGRVY